MALVIEFLLVSYLLIELLTIYFKLLIAIISYSIVGEKLSIEVDVGVVVDAGLIS